MKQLLRVLGVLIVLIAIVYLIAISNTIPKQRTTTTQTSRRDDQNLPPGHPMRMDTPTKTKVGWSNDPIQGMEADPKNVALAEKQRVTFARTHTRINAREAFRQGKLKLSSNCPEFTAEALLDGSIETRAETVLKDKDLIVEVTCNIPDCTIKVIPMGGSIGLTETKTKTGLKISAKSQPGPPYFMAGIADVEVWQQHK